MSVLGNHVTGSMRITQLTDNSDDSMTHLNGTLITHSIRER